MQFDMSAMTSVLQVHREKFRRVLQLDCCSYIQQRCKCDHGRNYSCCRIQSLPARVRDNELHVSESDITLQLNCGI
jgi:hypothetical protein